MSTQTAKMATRAILVPRVCLFLQLLRGDHLRTALLRAIDTKMDSKSLLTDAFLRPTSGFPNPNLQFAFGHALDSHSSHAPRGGVLHCLHLLQSQIQAGLPTPYLPGHPAGNVSAKSPSDSLPSIADSSC